MTQPTAPIETPAPKRAFKARYVVALVVCVAAVLWLVVGGLFESVVYLRDVSYAVEQRDSIGSKTFRMGGQVVPGTIAETNEGVRFELTDGETIAAVDLVGDPPDLFKECAPVVVEGRWDGTTFAGDRVLIKHGNQYKPEGYVPPSVTEQGCPDPEKS